MNKFKNDGLSTKDTKGTKWGKQAIFSNAKARNGRRSLPARCVGASLLAKSYREQARSYNGFIACWTG